jgi:hypothetical protein
VRRRPHRDQALRASNSSRSASHHDLAPRPDRKGPTDPRPHPNEPSSRHRCSTLAKRPEPPQLASDRFRPLDSL